MVIKWRLKGNYIAHFQIYLYLTLCHCSSLTTGTRTSFGFTPYPTILDSAKDLANFLENIARLESKELSKEELLVLYAEGKLHLKKYKDALYLGEVNEEGGRHGKGLMIYTNQRRYEGEWDKDLRHGRGYERHPNGNIYVGTFAMGKAHGHGMYKWTNGEQYDGQWD